VFFCGSASAPGILNRMASTSMHLTLKTEATKPAAANVLQQQARFDTFIERFNHERPHQALGMRVPGELYTRSQRP
jgi:putative transposase